VIGRIDNVKLRQPAKDHADENDPHVEINDSVKQSQDRADDYVHSVKILYYSNSNLTPKCFNGKWLGCCNGCV